ncbi:MAG: protein kinase domain-containing protein [Pirellulaceae bacterium]
MMDVGAQSITESLMAQAISAWRAGHRPDTADFLARHPELRRRQSVLLELAYEEYCLRKEAGESLTLESFCDRFPSCRRSLGRLLAVHDCGNEDVKLAATFDLDEVEWPAIGTNFLGFLLLQELGRGAFAHIYLARQPALGNRLVVVKVAQYGAAEAETLGRLAHRNIVPVYSVNEDRTSHVTAVCMPYLGSATLLDVLDVGFADNQPPERARFIQEIAVQESIAEAVPEMYVGPDPRLQHGTYIDGIVHLAVQLAEALQHTHQAGICHRDLKPSNVLLTPSGCPMLLDFNLSSDNQLERTFVGGTLPYMAPEQLQSMTSADMVQDVDTDPRSDLFSLGVILYELFTGRLPFSDRPPGAAPSEAAALIRARQQRGCPGVRRYNPRVNAKLSRLVDQCLACDPAQRPASAQALAAALRGQLTPAVRLERWMSRRKFLVGCGTLTCGLIGGASITALSARDPFAVRKYEAGVREFQAGRFAEAAAQFTHAHHARPLAYQPLLARGQARLQTADYLDAIADFEQAHALSPQGQTAAWVGYACDCAELGIPAEVNYRQAIETYRYETVAVWNNRGRNACRRNSYTAAIDHLTRALQLDPQCATAYHNRALVYARCGTDSAANGTSYGQLAIDDIEQALALGPPTGWRSVDAAQIHDRFDRQPGAEQRVRHYAQQAGDLGFHPQDIPELAALTISPQAAAPPFSASRSALERDELRMALPPHFPPLPE